MIAPLAYLNGKYIPGEQAALPVWDRGLVQGATITEMVRTFQRIPFRLSEHLARFRGAMKYLGVVIPESDQQLAEIVQHLIESGDPGPASHADWGIVFIVTAGAIPMYAGGHSVSDSPTVCVHLFPLPFRNWSSKYQYGQSLVVPSIRQIPSAILDPRVKSRSRLHWYLADRQAQAVDSAAVALLQNAQGYLTETNSGNFFIVSQGQIRTAREVDTLPGISQQFVKELAHELAIPYEVGDITLACALQAEEAFLTSTTYCVLPVTRLNQQAIGNGTPGTITLRLLQSWSHAVGLDVVCQAQQDHEHP